MFPKASDGPHLLSPDGVRTRRNGVNLDLTQTDRMELAIDEHRRANAMAKKKRHSRVEIATKLAQGNELATQGKLQSEIARTLGVSVMTLHRWRKAPPGPQPALVATPEAREPDRTRGANDRIAELQLENSRLRRLVTDLLLEKVKLEEAAQSQSSVA